MAECPCTNISIMQLFHELKQKFPAVPDRIVTECIQLNAHDKVACEAFLAKENQSYSFPGGRVCKMAAEGNQDPCRPDSLQLEDTFDRRLLGRQSLDSLRCTRNTDRRMCKQYSEEFLHKTKPEHSDIDHSAFSRLSIQDESWNSRRSSQHYQEEVECSGCDGSCHCERTRVSVVSYGSGSPHSAPVTPSNYPVPPFPPIKVDVTAERRRTKLNIEPVPHYQGLPEPARPYTSVNLTLRPPSSEPQPPIDIRSGAGNLTYSSCSYDPRQGYQSRLQISIGPGGQGTVTAARALTHLPPPASPALRPALSMPDVTTTSAQLAEPALHHLPPATKVLVTKQLERKERLSHELRKYKERLIRMNLDVQNMRADLEARLQGPSRVKKLQDDITFLQKQCKQMADEVDRNAKIRNVNTENLPLGETNEEFYKNIYTGQLLPRQAVRPRLPSVDVAASSASVGTAAGTSGAEARNWTCHVCTFRNHPALDNCEQCDMPRIITGPETQNIHIHVTHHNVQSSPCRRVVHSWVV